VDDVVLDPVEAGPRTLTGPGLDTPKDEIALTAPVFDVEPVLVREHARERLADQLASVPPVEPDVLAIVGAEALRGAGGHVADRSPPMCVDRLHGRRVDRVIVSR